MSAMKLGPPHPPVPPIPSTTPAMLVNWSGDAMDTLKLKIGLLKRENVDSSLKMAEAEKVHLKYIYHVKKIIMWSVFLIAHFVLFKYKMLGVFNKNKHILYLNLYLVQLQ